jgi:FkbM family methyltransferase
MMALPRFLKPKQRLDDEQKIVQSMLHQGIDMVLDIGANKGQTRDALRKNGFIGDIVSIEPVPALHPLLQEKALKDLKWRVLEPFALGEKAGTCRINVSKAPDMSSLLAANDRLMTAYPKTQVLESVEIPMRTLDEVYESLQLQNRRVLIKIDTQGYEMAILKGGAEALRQAQGVRVEMSLLELYEGEALYTDIIALLAQYGYAPHILIDIGYSRALSRQLQLDGVFYKTDMTP